MGWEGGSMELQLANCPQCGKLFRPGVHDVCPACVKLVEEQYEKCAAYLRENRHATIYELSEETVVSVRQITKFIREGRISLSDAPNLKYPCSSCGKLIGKGMMCDACRLKLKKEIAHIRDDDERKRDMSREQMRKAGYKFKEYEKKLK
jgi:flagellar operon protein (TIGR03826 family)